MIPSQSPFEITESHIHYEVNYGNLNQETLRAYIPSDASEPTPVVIDFHGGGFTSGDKDSRVVGSESFINGLLGNDIAFITCNYPLLNTINEKRTYRLWADSAIKAVQFIRSRAEILNIDKEKVGLRGGSGGAGISMWLAYNQDQADPNSADPLKRESTLAKSISLSVPQATYDFVKWGSDVFSSVEGYDPDRAYYNVISDKRGLDRAYGINDISEIVNESSLELRRDFDMIRFIREYAQDVETRIFNSKGVDNVLVDGFNVNDPLHNILHVEVIVRELSNKGLPYEVDCNALGLTTLETELDFFIRTLKQQ